MTNCAYVESPSSVAKCSFAKEAIDVMPSIALPLQKENSFPSFSDDDESIPTADPMSDLQTLTSKVHRLLSFENLDDCIQSETVQACSLSLRTRLPHILNTSDIEQPTVCKRQSALALLRATHYVERIEQGLNIQSTTSLDEQLRTVLAGLDVNNFPESVRESIRFRLSPWVHGFDLPVGAKACTVLESNGRYSAVVVEVEPVVEFRTGDITSVRYATSAAKACAVAIKSCKHVGSRIGHKAGIIGEGTIQIHIAPLGSSNMVDHTGKSMSLQIKEIRLHQVNAFPRKPAANIDLFTSHTHGNSGVTVTSTFKTCTTANNETPIIHIELCMAPPLVV